MRIVEAGIGGRFHGSNSGADALGKDRQVLASFGKQSNLPLISAMHRPPADAPPTLLRQIESDAQALAVSMKICGAKLAYIAACVGKSEGYLSRLRSGDRRIPDALVDVICLVTGTNLLRQYRDLHRAMNLVAEG